MISKEDLIRNDVKITQKYVRIKSSEYESDALEYILSLVDANGSVAFISDTHKIYAQGQYYGGDVFKEDLAYFTDFTIMNDDGTVEDGLSAQKMGSTMKLTASDGVDLSVVESNGEQSLNIGYDLGSVVDGTSFMIDTKSEYSLGVVDGKITMHKYTPCHLTVHQLQDIEFDSGDTLVEISYEVTGTDPLTQLEIHASIGDSIIDETRTRDGAFYAMVPDNTDVTFTIDYSDGRTTKRATVKQSWGYAFAYGTYKPEHDIIEIGDWLVANGLSACDKYISRNSQRARLMIDQAIGEYAFYACPVKFVPAFVDESTNLQGGWTKLMKMECYSFSEPYQIWITDNSGLGEVLWDIDEE